LMAGINSAARVKSRLPVVLTRAEAYIGVLIDDLVTKGTREPYRMFTSRAEYRLLLREDNADLRLLERGYELGLVKEDIYRRFMGKREEIQRVRKLLKEDMLMPGERVNQILAEAGSSPIRAKASLEELMRRTEVDFDIIERLKEGGELKGIDSKVSEQVEIQVKYEGYITRQAEQVRRFNALESIPIPDGFDFQALKGLRREEVEKLTGIGPRTVGQASRVSGVTPAAIGILMVYLRGKGKKARCDR